MADADNVDAGAQAVVEVHHAGERHVAAVAAAGDQHAAGVEVGLGRHPVEQRADVLHRILALHAVVELEIALAIAVAAAHVGHQHGDAELLHVELEGRREGRQRLRLRAAVDVDDDRTLAARGTRGLVDEGRDALAVEARITHQRGLDEAGGVEPADLALGPARQAAFAELECIDIRGARRAVDGEGELLALAIELDAVDLPDRQLRRGHRLAAGQGDEM